MFSLLSIPALLLALAGCSLTEPTEDATATHERRLIGDDAPVHAVGDLVMNDTDLLSGDGDEIRLEEGQRVALPDFDATLTFVEKTQDNRCPTNVVCIWEGEATILLEFARSGQAPATFEMKGFVGPDGNAEAGIAHITHEAFGLRFTLDRLDPYPLDGIAQTDPVTATIRVETL